MEGRGGTTGVHTETGVGGRTISTTIRLNSTTASLRKAQLAASVAGGTACSSSQGAAVGVGGG